jgi:hypothetical protein
MSNTPVRPASVRLAQPRRWTTLAAASVSLATLGTAHAEVRLPQLPIYHHPASQDAQLWTVASEGGEGGESGGITTGDDTVDFLANLLMIEGHLTSGFTLWSAGDHNNGQAHMGHPYAEVYAGIEDKLKDLGAAQFEDELEALVDAAAAGKPDTDLQALRDQISVKIDAARKAAADGEPKDEFTAIVNLLRKAGKEYGDGVKSGAVTDLHEYQDAWGFVQAAKARATVLDQSDNASVKQAAETTLRTLAELDEAVPAVAPEAALPGEESWFLAAAAKIELGAYKVK